MRPSVTLEKISEILRRRALGQSFTEIAAAVGVSVSSVSNALRWQTLPSDKGREP